MPRPRTATRPKCAYCGDPFHRKNDQQKFCKEECRLAYHKNGPAVARIRDWAHKEITAAITLLEARMIFSVIDPERWTDYIHGQHPERPRRDALKRALAVLTSQVVKS